MHLLRGAVRTYAWGSRTAIAEFTGRPSPTAHPEAELWFGAHPGDPAWLETDQGERSLLDTLREDPEGELGAAVRDRFGDTLPFLLKVLAADEPLSLQAHPSAEQAVEGFAREDKLGIPVSGADTQLPRPQPQARITCCARAIRGAGGIPFRRAQRRADACAGGGGPGPVRQSARRLSPTPTVCGRCSPRGSPRRSPISTCWCPRCIDGAIQYLRSGKKKKFAAEAKTVLELGERYPGDAGVLASMLLNRISLSPGEGIYLPAGNLHAYLHGVGVEVMANSDNVLRGGLTPKHVDVPELLRVLDFTPATDVVIRPENARDGMELVYDTPAPEFAVSVLRIDGEQLGHEIDAPTRHDGPQILLCTEGSTVVHAKTTAVTLDRGSAAWVSADDGPIRLVAQQPTKLFRATVGI